MLCCFGRSKKPKQTPATATTTPISTSQAPHLSPSIASQLPSCTLIRLLGEGTYGTVVLVCERCTSTYFAVKIMSKPQLVHENQLTSITRERQILRLAGPHPFIIKCVSAFQTTEAVVLVLEYLSGGDLYDLMRCYGGLGEKEVRFYLAEIVVGVGELHKNGFVFRDLKLENILLDGQGHVRLTDFGLADCVDDGGTGGTGGGHEDEEGGLKGTAIYWAPELVGKGKVEKGMIRVVDWWALGVLAYVLICGRAPFGLGQAAGNREELCRRIREVELDIENDERLKHVGKSCKDLITKLLTKDPRVRLGSAESDVEQVMQHEFFKGIDWNLITEYKLKPPLEPPLKPPKGVVEKEGQEVARERFSDKLGRKYEKRRAGRKTGVLKEEEYRNVTVKQNGGNRISIGLDFDGKNEGALKKSWTGEHTGDFGRVVV